MLIHCHLCKLHFYHQSWLHKIASSFYKSIDLVETSPCWKQIFHIKLESFKLPSTYTVTQSWKPRLKTWRSWKHFQLLWGVTLYPTLKDLTIQKCFPIKMLHKILYKWIWILLMMLHICFTLPVKNTNMLMVSDQTLFVSKKEMQNVHLIAKRKSICVICFPWKDRSSCYLIDEMLYTKLTVINTILRYHFKSCKCNALEYVLGHLHCYLLGINSSSCLKHLYWGGGEC